MFYKSKYQPERPGPGRYLIRILKINQEADHIALSFDIAVGPSAGYAHIFYLQTGKWPCVWRIHNNNAGQVVMQYALRAINKDSASPIDSLTEAANHLLSVEIDLYNDKYFNVRRSFPASSYCIAPDDIRIDTGSWAGGTRNAIRATYLADLSGLPVLCADRHESKSPMIDWCAANNIILLPSLFPAGDYMVPNGNVIVDRKADLFELRENFILSTNRASYENAACYAASLGKKLIYITGTAEEGHVSQLDDLLHWFSQNPQKPNEIVNGIQLHGQLIRYMEIHPNAEFRFVPYEVLCTEIYQAVCA